MPTGLIEMCKKIKYIIISVICLLFIVMSITYAADSVSFKFKNSTDQKAIVYLYWLDHGLDYPGPFNLACGEMKPGQIWKVENNYKIGEYVILWRSMDSKDIKITYISQMSGLITNELTMEDIK